ncbi:MAG: ParB/RepB/Spo0J family partition protein [Chloroflexi bacterium]|jgi:ParB family chromosome partitioning protein|nr:ParB/RepB/Spo0J family partition protein [Chloroflexota bacterium]
MAKKRPKISLTQAVKPRGGDIEQLFSADDDVEQASGLQLLALRVEAIQPDPDQPRNTFPQDSLRELSESIRQDGVIQPIEVTEIRPNVYVIVHGERRWRAARMAGLATVPAVVRRRDYNQLTRFVRQLVENIQREDLNDVDRAAGMIRLRDMLQEELNRAREEDVPSDKPWAKKITWAKVGERLGYSRQRIHQLIKLLDLPDEIKEAVQDGKLTERDTRVYQGLRPSQQRALHRALMAGDLSSAEMRQVSRLLKDAPNLTVHQAIRLLKEPETRIEPVFDPPTAQDISDESEGEGDLAWLSTDTNFASSGHPGGIQRLVWARGHLHRVQPQGLSRTERQEIVRLLQLIQQDVNSLLAALGKD